MLWFVLLALFHAMGSVVAQEPTKEEWIAAFKSYLQPQKRLEYLKNEFEKVRDGKVQNGTSTRNDNGWVFGSKREKQARFEKAKSELIAEKRRIWTNKDIAYPQVDAYELKKGDVGIVVIDLPEIEGYSEPLSIASPDAASALQNEQSNKLIKVQSYKVLQVLSKTEFLCTCGKVTILFSGVDTSKMRDGQYVKQLGLMYCVGNSTYATAGGSTKTVMKVVQVSDATAKKLMAETQAELQETRVRTWTDVTGKHKTEAQLVDYDGKKVTLKKTDSTSIIMPITKFSQPDRRYVEETLGAPEK